MSVRWRLGAALATAALAVGLTGCGVPVDKQPAALSRSGIPFGLLDPNSPEATSTTSPIEVPVEIFLIAPTSHLVAAARDVPVHSPDLQAVLTALVAGPTDAESKAGLQTALPAQTTVIDAPIGTGGVATVNLGGSFAQLVGPPLIQAVAQIVFTASSVPGVTGVTFEFSGQPVQVPVASGVEVPLANTSQFAALAPTGAAP